MSNELQSLRLRQAVAELRKLDRQLDERNTQPHVSFMRSSAANFDARELLRLATELQSETLALGLRASALGSGKSYSAGSRPPQEVAPGRYTPSSGGEVAEFRTLLSKVSRRLNALATDLSAFSMEANAKINDPGRYGDAALSNPVNDLFSFIQGILDLIRKAKGF